MPTARPIIIEKFIDHTDSGVTAAKEVQDREPDRDAREREDERQAGGDEHPERDEQQDQGWAGR